MRGRSRKREQSPGGRDVSSGDSLLRMENTELKRAVAQLTLLNDLAQAIGVSVSADEMIRAIAHRAKEALAAEQVAIYFIERTATADAFKTKVRDATYHRRQTFHFGDALRAMMARHRAPFRSNDPHGEPRLQSVELDPDLRSLLCVPLLVRGQLTGLVVACNKKHVAGFDDEDERLLAIIANQSAQILETTRLREEEAAYERLQRDVLLARDIQAALLPDTPPVVPGYDIAGCSFSAELVGGDYYDYIELDQGRWGICLGDVSGKGVPASLLMANVQATLRGQARASSSVGECMCWANRLLCRSTAPDKFATLFYCILDPNIHEIRYCNAGHERPLLVVCSRAGSCVKEVVEAGLALGILDDYPYVESSLNLHPGELLLVFSDGLTDAVNATDQPFGRQGVERVLQSLDNPTSREILDAFLAAVKDHAGPVPAYDDVTIMVIRRLAAADH